MKPFIESAKIEKARPVKFPFSRSFSCFLWLRVLRLGGSEVMEAADLVEIVDCPDVFYIRDSFGQEHFPSANRNFHESLLEGSVFCLEGSEDNGIFPVLDNAILGLVWALAVPQRGDTTVKRN